MTIHGKRTAKSHDDVLEDIAQSLDIPESRFIEAQERYNSLGEWLDREDSSLSRFKPEISPQGSFLLGTVIRPLTEADEYDVDLVCLLQGTLADFTQKTLKESVGREVKLYAKARNMTTGPKEGRRCWTLHYADGAQFHMDVLPAIPDAQRYRKVMAVYGHTDLAKSDVLSGQAIAITDNTLPQYAQQTDDWPLSNPMGYAAWFKSRMAAQLMERKKAFAARQTIQASVDDIPDYKVKTPLQRAIQLLKRHRDIMFAEEGRHKPISIIITTLAAHSYNEEQTISTALQSILRGMDQYIEIRDGVAWIPNPVNPEENFADKWAEEPKKRKNFFAWLEQARHDFAAYLRASRFDAMPLVLKEALGSRLVDRSLASVLPAAASPVAPAVVKAASDPADRRTDAAVREIERAGPQSKPWKK